MPIGFDKVVISNMALSRIGSKSTIESLTEETVAARVCRLWYDAARRASLEAFNWSFARKSGLLAPHSVAAPSNRWVYRYIYPSDCVAPRLIENPLGVEADAVSYEVETAGNETLSIVTDQETPYLIYTFDLTNTDLFSLHFVAMVSTKLGELINSELSGKTSVAGRLEKRFSELRLEAPTMDASGQIAKKERDASWIRERV